ncbi:MAG: hypothetical protein IPL61_26960 [Myxococcales bacterium]|nr:hypothetical protein [Myxococcales bacterium]
MDTGIANILHRGTIATIAGVRTFERGERCFAAGRVAEVIAGPGELRGVVRPTEATRAPYAVRLWVRADGLAYACTCPVGLERHLCKHTVAITLAHLERQRVDAERGVDLLRQALTAIPTPALVDGLLGLARRDAALADELKRLCLDALART